ncbi:MAG: ribonuclease P protein component [Pseudomonadales bacterium]|nr:ribonuclease P protein component [Pseudomonadales bacterium]
MGLFAFKRHQRLLSSGEYKFTFDNAKIRFSSPILLVLATEQNQLADIDPKHVLTNQAKLGLVVSKKHLKRAIDRNRFKRVTRESFRLHQQQLVGLNLVVLARAGAKDAGKETVSELLEKAWRYIERKRLIKADK